MAVKIHPKSKVKEEENQWLRMEERIGAQKFCTDVATDRWTDGQIDRWTELNNEQMPVPTTCPIATGWSNILNHQ